MLETPLKSFLMGMGFAAVAFIVIVPIVISLMGEIVEKKKSKSSKTAAPLNARSLSKQHSPTQLTEEFINDDHIPSQPRS